MEIRPALERDATYLVERPDLYVKPLGLDPQAPESGSKLLAAVKEGLPLVFVRQSSDPDSASVTLDGLTVAVGHWGTARSVLETILTELSKTDYRTVYARAAAKDVEAWLIYGRLGFEKDESASGDDPLMSLNLPWVSPGEYRRQAAGKPIQIAPHMWN